MMEETDIDLLVELDRIMAKYGNDSFSRIAAMIRDPKRTEELAVALEFVAARGTRRRATTRSSKSDRVGMQVLNKLRMSDPDKHAVLAEIRRELVSGTILHSMAEFRQFALANNLSLGKASSRTAAIAPLLRSLSELSTPEIASLRDSLVLADVNDRSLESWRNVIVRPKTSPKLDKG